MTQGRTTRVRNFKFCYGYREERDTQRKEVGKGPGNNFAVSLQGYWQFQAGSDIDIENGHVDTGWEGDGGTNREIMLDI